MNDNTLTDEQALEQFLELLKTRISITTGFSESDKDGIYTHQFIRIGCGDLAVVSDPQPLELPLQLAPVSQLGVTIN